MMNRQQWIKRLEYEQRNREGLGLYVLDTFNEEVSELLANNDKQIRNEVMIDTLNSVLKMIANLGREDITSVVLKENLKAKIEQIKREQNEL